MRSLAFLLCLIVALSGAHPALAFGLRTHLWMGQRLLDDILPDCQVTITGDNYDVPKDVCESIRANPGAFLAGTLGPDAYPDLVTGQVTTHPGIKNDWQTSDWLRHLYDAAPAGAALAFGSGYVVHTAGDTFAHTYVNALSGDIFSLEDERAVERRHFVLEKYIDSRLPAGGPDPASMTVPSEYLADKLILNADAARVAAKSKIALHIPAMYGLYTSVGALDRELDGLEADAGKRLAELVTLGTDLQIKLVDGEAALKSTEVVLATNEARLNVEKLAYDQANQAFNDAVAALKANEDLIRDSDLRAKAARIAIDEGHRALTAANQALDDGRRAVEQLEARLSSLPREVAERVCQEVKKRICENAPWPLNEICKFATELHCSVVNVPNRAWEDVSREVRNARSRVLDLESEIRRQTLDIAAQTATELNELEAKARAEAINTSLRAGEEAAKAAFAVMDARYQLELSATTKLRDEVANLRGIIADLRSRIIDTDSLRTEIAALVDRSNVISFYTKNWLKGMRVSSSKLIEASLTSSTRLAAGEEGGMRPYAEWMTCYGGAFTPVPYQLGEFGCEAVSAYERVQAEFDRVVERILPEPFATLYREINKLKTGLKAEIKQKAEDAALELVKLAAPDGATADMIELMARPQLATADKLNAIFAVNDDAAGKALLTFPRVTDLVDVDLGVTDGKLDPQHFNALKHALTLAKIALLDRTELAKLVRNSGSKPGLLRTSAGGARYSILFDTLRSIDGNHQWQPYGLPYARAAILPTLTPKPEPINAEERRYGYGPADPQGGFSLFINPTLRRDVFLRVFKGGVGGKLMEQPELSRAKFPFPECLANPFPVAFNPDGSAAEEDLTCREVIDLRKPPKPPFMVRMRRFWFGLFS